MMKHAAILIALMGFGLVVLKKDGIEIQHSLLRSRMTTLSLRSDDADSRSPFENISTLPSEQPTVHPHHGHDTFCSLTQAGSVSSTTPSQWWTAHFDDIWNASLQHPKDPTLVYRNWTLEILASLSPELLEQGVRSRPSSHNLRKLASRLHARLVDPHHEPPIQIVVVGGSVTRGQRCHEPVLNGTKPMNPTLCAWPSRVEKLINTLAGRQVVQVYNLAVSATGIDFGTPLIKYWLYPPELPPHGPDVVVASYSTNEQAFGHGSIDKFINHERNLLQEFIAASHWTRACDPPLLLLVDDYLGNRHNGILDETAFNKVSTEVADWYANVMHVSYADVVRRVLYANTQEMTFTQWPIDGSSGNPKKEVHFGMGGHVAISWTILYAMVHVFTGYCDNQVFEERMKREGHTPVVPKSVMDMVNTVPPPKLTQELSLRHVSRLWQDNVRRVRQAQLECKNDDNTTTSGGPKSKSPCEFAFLFGPAFTVQDPDMYNEYVRPYLVSSDGWEAVMEYGKGGQVEKPGLIATRANATMTLKLTDIQRVVRVINLQRIKSYSEKWAGSTARFTIRVESPGKKNVFRTQFDVVGYHKEETSVSFPHEYDLKDNKAVKGSNITVTIDLVGGTTFKILGMMFCRM